MTPFVSTLWPATGPAPAPEWEVTTANSFVDTLETTHTFTLPADRKANDFVIINVRLGTSGPTLAAITGWTVNAISSVAGYAYQITRVLDGSEGATVTATSSEATRFTSLAVKVRGAAVTVTPFFEYQDGASLTPPTLAPTWGVAAETLFVNVLSAKTADWVAEPPSGYGAHVVSPGAGTSQSTRARIEKAHRVATIASESPGAWTLTTLGSFTNARNSLMGLRKAA